MLTRAGPGFVIQGGIARRGRRWSWRTASPLRLQKPPTWTQVLRKVRLLYNILTRLRVCRALEDGWMRRVTAPLAVSLSAGLPVCMRAPAVHPLSCVQPPGAQVPKRGSGRWRASRDHPGEPGFPAPFDPSVCVQEPCASARLRFNAAGAALFN
jgi:hypothetical protein